MEDYTLVFHLICPDCQGAFYEEKEIDEGLFLKNLEHVDGYFVTNPGYFIKDKLEKTWCKKCHPRGKLLKCNHAIIVKKGSDICKDVYGVEKEELSRSAKRRRLQLEWQEELNTNEDYWCQICHLPFSQPLRVSGEAESICPKCS